MSITPGTNGKRPNVLRARSIKSCIRVCSYVNDGFGLQTHL